MKKIKYFPIHYPKTSLILALSIFLIHLYGALNLKSDYRLRVWFPDHNKDLQNLIEFEKEFGNDEVFVLGLQNDRGLFDYKGLSLIQDLTRDLWTVPDIIRVDSLANYNFIRSEDDDIAIDLLIPDSLEEQDDFVQIKQKALHDHMAPNYLVNKKGTLAVLYAIIKPPLDGPTNHEKIGNGMREVLSKYKNNPAYKDYTFHMSGSGAVIDAFRITAVEDMSTMLPLSASLIFIFIVGLFRSFKAAFIAMIVIGFSIGSAFGLATYLDIKFDNFISAIPGILIAIAIADTVHLFSTFFKNREKMGKENAIKRMIDKNFVPTILTSLTTSIGFMSLLISEINPVYHLGILAGYGCLLAWLFTFLVVPPCFTLFDIAAKVKKKALIIKGEPIVSFLQRFRWPIIVTFTLVSLAGVYFGAQNEVNSNPLHHFSKHTPIRLANDYIIDEMGGVSGPEIVIDSHKPEGVKEVDFLKHVDSFSDWLKSQPYTNKVHSIIPILKKMNQSLEGGGDKEYRLPPTRQKIAEALFLYSFSLPQGHDLNHLINSTNQSMRMSVSWAITDSKTTIEKIQEIEEQAKKMGLDAHVSGKSPLYHGMNKQVVDTFVESLAMALVLVGLILSILFRSPLLGLFSMLPNIIPLMIGSGLMTLMEKPIDIGTAVVATVCLGIAVDDTIHFLMHFYRNRKEGIDLRKNLSIVFEETGPALVETTLILFVGFGVFAFANFIPNSNFGILCALILLVALLVDIIFLPALLLLGQKGAKSNGST